MKTTIESHTPLSTPLHTENKSSSNQEESSREECEEDPLKMEVSNHAFTQLPFEEKAPKVVE